MSYSSLWVMDKDFNGTRIQKFHNSHLFNPVVWDTLSRVYLPLDRYGYPQSVIGFNGETVWHAINDIMNASETNCDRVCWELSNEQTFFTKDKDFLIKNIEEFKQQISSDKELVLERFDEIVKAIKDIDGEKHPYFAIEATSVSDDILQWFENYDEKTDEYIKRPLSEVEEHVTEFVVIEDEKIKQFISNTKFCNPYEAVTINTND